MDACSLVEDHVRALEPPASVVEIDRTEVGCAVRSEEDVFVNQLAMAGWTGLFITGLNLIPLGQLDGGHVIFSLFGMRAQRLYFPLLAGFFTLSFFNSAWLFWTLLLLLLGRVYASPLDTVTDLDPKRRWLGYITLVLFLLVFVPNPLHPVG